MKNVCPEIQRSKGAAGGGGVGTQRDSELVELSMGSEICHLNKAVDELVDSDDNDEGILTRSSTR